MKFSKLVIIDNTLKNTVGHHYEYAKAVSDEGRKRGMEVIVASHKLVEPAVKNTMSTLPVFHQGLYDKYLQPDKYKYLGKSGRALIYNYCFLRDMRKAGLLKIINSQTIIFIPNCVEIMVPGLVLWMSFYSNLSRPKLILLFRREPRRIMSFVAKLMKPFVDEGTIMLTTDSDQLAKALGNAAHLPFTVLPIPHLPHLSENKKTEHAINAPVRITYLGDARMEKGIDVLAKTLPLLSKELQEKKIEFVIQCHRFVDEPEITEVLRLLDEAQSSFGNAVRLIKKPLSTEDYYQLLKDTDAVVVPYRKSEYQARTSGILAEAFAAGKPVIVTNGTWMSGQVEQHGSGFGFNDGDIEDLAKSIRKLADEFTALSIDAHEKAEKWQKFHSASGLVDLITTYWK